MEAFGALTADGTLVIYRPVPSYGTVFRSRPAPFL